MKCKTEGCKHTNHLQNCKVCGDGLYCRKCVRRHWRKEHGGDKEQRALQVKDVPQVRRQMRYQCPKCKKRVKEGGVCLECGITLKRVKE